MARPFKIQKASSTQPAASAAATLSGTEPGTRIVPGEHAGAPASAGGAPPSPGWRETVTGSIAGSAHAQPSCTSPPQRWTAAMGAAPGAARIGPAGAARSAAINRCTARLPTADCRPSMARRSGTGRGSRSAAGAGGPDGWSACCPTGSPDRPVTSSIRVPSARPRISPPCPGGAPLNTHPAVSVRGPRPGRGPRLPHRAETGALARRLAGLACGSPQPAGRSGPGCGRMTGHGRRRERSGRAVGACPHPA